MRRSLDSVPGFYIPPSATMREDVSILRNNRAVKHYDERLRFGKNEEQGDWVVFMMMPHGEAARPILGFGANIPETDEMMQRLKLSDTLRHGEFMRDDINEHNERERRRMEKASIAKAHDAAERVEVWHRHAGSHPAPRVFVPDTDATEKVKDGDS